MNMNIGKLPVLRDGQFFSKSYNSVTICLKLLILKRKYDILLTCV